MAYQTILALPGFDLKLAFPYQLPALWNTKVEPMAIAFRHFLQEYNDVQPRPHLSTHAKK
ncbi:hypothetical protein ARZXY2_2869 [Arthrobacter sp. ZXY-2]|nr:hypothetical protein ARZXY2_2869 [Arthrobacter sp. ZXY-2]